MATTEETLRLAEGLRVHIGSAVDDTVRELTRAWVRAWDEIRSEWVAAAAEISQLEDPSPWTILQTDRAQRALAAANAEIARLSELAGVTIIGRLEDVTSDTPEWQARIIASQLPPAAGTRVELVAAFNRLSVEALQAIVERSTQDITVATYRLGAGTQEIMRRELVRGIAVGDNPRRVAAEMVRRAEGGFNGGLTRALTIARTEMLDAHRAAAAAAQASNESVLSAWEWIAQLDTRTCPSCWGQHGRRFELDEPGPLDHQQGRCARLTVTKSWRELGFAIDEPPSVLPDAETTFWSLPEEDRLAIMGPTRLEALQSGDVSLRDMSVRRSNPGWRDSFVPVPARQVRTLSAATAVAV